MKGKMNEKKTIWMKGKCRICGDFSTDITDEGICGKCRQEIHNEMEKIDTGNKKIGKLSAEGVVLKRNGEALEALERFDKALQRDSSLGTIWFLKSLVHMGLMKIEYRKRIMWKTREQFLRMKKCLSEALRFGLCQKNEKTAVSLKHQEWYILIEEFEDDFWKKK
ncbi:MAG: hypothetical protein ACOC5D_06390 [Thermoplasmatota archaeon]